MQRLIADTGYLVALGRKDDPRHAGAARFAARWNGKILTSSAIVVEACHFLAPSARIDLLDMVGSGELGVLEIPVGSYDKLARILRKYADLDVDFADASLVWLAEQTGVRSILTVDIRDFSVLRLRSGKRFELVDWN